MINKKTLLITLVMLLLSLTVSACVAPSVDQLIEEAAPAEEQAPAEEAVVAAPEEEQAPAEEAVEEAPAAAAEADLDSAFGTFLGDLQGYGVITVDALNTALAEEPPFLLDVRQPEELEDSGYIEGAINIPLRELAQHTDLLPAFEAPIVVYCGSGTRSTIAMTALEALGWADVKSMKGGIAAWVDAGYPVAEGPAPEAEALAAATPDPALLASIDTNLNTFPEGWGVVDVEGLAADLAENPDIVLLDVRRQDELDANGWIEGSTHIAIEEFIAQKANWPANLDAPIVAYCGSGWRSAIAMTILRTYGYTDVRSLKGGFGAWAEAGNPAVGGLNPAFSTFLGSMEGYGVITVQDLNTALAEIQPFLLDVRQPEELEETGYIEGAINIPLRELAQHTDLLPAFDTPIAVYCGSGTRSTIAMTALEALGWTDVKSMKGGIAAWLEAGYPVAEGPAPEAEVLDAATPDPALLASIDANLSTFPDGWGIVDVEGLATDLAENPDIVLLDVRRQDELDENGWIEGSTHIAIEEFIAGQANWPADHDAPVVVYCGSGWRSAIAMTIMRTYGYTDVRSLKGGFGAWAEAGNPVVQE